MQRFVLVVGCLVLIACGRASSSPATSPSQPQPPTQEAKLDAPPPAAGDDDREALLELDDANPRSLDRAVEAADRIGERRDAAAIDALAAVAARAPSKKRIAAQIAAMRALGRMTGAKAKAAEVLATVLARQAPPRPTSRETEEAYALHLAVVGSAVNASAELGERSLVGVLVPLIYRTPELSSQLRRAYAAIGGDAAAEFRKVLRGQHAAAEAALRAVEDKARPTSAREFYAALVLGDLRDASARADLFALIAKPALPAYYFEDEAATVTQHTAAFDSLRKLGAPDAAPKLEAIWKSPKAKLEDRVGAILAYAFCARDTSAVEALAKIALDNGADDGLRTEAATAVGRLGRDKKHIDAFLQMAKKYTDAAAKKRAAADKLEPKKKQADIALEDANDAAENAKAKLVAMTQDGRTTAEQIRAATDAAKKAADKLKAAKQKHREQTGEWKANDAAAKAYVGYARLFQTHVARIELAIRCKNERMAVEACYLAALRTTPDEVAREVKKYIADVDSWSAEEKLGLAEAYADRAMVELGKRGPLAEDKLAHVLEALANEDRLVRESILNALPAIAPAKCPPCIAALDAALEAGRSKTYLAALQIETHVMRNYMASR